LLDAIVAFRIDIDSIEAKQNSARIAPAESVPRQRSSSDVTPFWPSGDLRC
jgi:hypothetical protein